jgi:hypothetical protein
VQFPVYISYNGKYKRRNTLYCSRWRHNSHYPKYNSFSGLLNLWTWELSHISPTELDDTTFSTAKLFLLIYVPPLSKVRLPRKLQINVLYTVPVYPSQIGHISRSHSECTVLTVTINVGSDPKWHVTQITYATKKCFMNGAPPLPGECSTLLSQEHRAFSVIKNRPVAERKWNDNTFRMNKDTFGKCTSQLRNISSSCWPPKKNKLQCTNKACNLVVILYGF